RLLGIISHLFSPISKVGIWNRSPKVRDFMISVYLPYAHHRRFDGVVVFYSKVFQILDLGRGVTVKALEEDIQPSPVQQKTIRKEVRVRKCLIVGIQVGKSGVSPQERHNISVKYSAVESFLYDEPVRCLVEPVNCDALRVGIDFIKPVGTAAV